MDFLLLFIVSLFLDYLLFFIKYILILFVELCISFSKCFGRAAGGCGR